MTAGRRTSGSRARPARSRSPMTRARAPRCSGCSSGCSCWWSSSPFPGRLGAGAGPRRGRRPGRTGGARGATRGGGLVTGRSERARRTLRRPGTALVGVILVLLVVGVPADLTAGQGAAAGPGPQASAPTHSTRSTARTVPVARAERGLPRPHRRQPHRDPAQPRGARCTGNRQRSEGRRRPRARTADRSARRRDTTRPGCPVVGVGPGGPDNGPDTGPVVARGTGASAPGMAAGLLTRSGVPAMRGLLGTTCAAPGTDFWFVGSGAVVGQRGRIYLTNPEPAPAVVDVTLYGPDGAIDAPAGRGIAVAAGAQEVTLLDALAPGTTVFAVNVHVRSGRISAAVRDQQVVGLTPKGADWLPPAAAPARHQLIPGVLSGTGERRLQVVAPGESDAIVKVRLVAESGTFAPAGLDVIEVAAGTVKDVDLAPFGTGDAFAVDLDSDDPSPPGSSTESPQPAARSRTSRTPQRSRSRPRLRGWPPRRGSAPVSPRPSCWPRRTGPSPADRVLPPATGTPRSLTVPDGSQCHRPREPRCLRQLCGAGADQGGSGRHAGASSARRTRQARCSPRCSWHRRAMPCGCPRSRPTCRPACGRAGHLPDAVPARISARSVRPGRGRTLVPILTSRGRSSRAQGPGAWLPARPRRRAPAPPSLAPSGPGLHRPAIDGDASRPLSDGRVA